MKKTCLSTLLVLGVGLAVSHGAGAAQDSYRNLDTRECPILDTPYTTAWSAETRYILPADTGTLGWGDQLSAVELAAWARFLSIENDLGSELEIRGLWDTLILTGFEVTEGADSSYPLTMGRLALVWSQRFVQGYGMQVDAAPGLYSSLDSVGGDDLAVPAGLTLIKALSPDAAVFVGATVYPSFDLQADPRAGFYLARRDAVVVQVAYPESRFEFSPVDSLRFVFGARVQLWPEYNLGEDDPRGRLLYDEARAYGGFEWNCTRNVALALQGGYVFGRTVEFETSETEIEIDDAPFAAFGVRGRL